MCGELLTVSVVQCIRKGEIRFQRPCDNFKFNGPGEKLFRLQVVQTSASQCYSMKEENNQFNQSKAILPCITPSQHTTPIRICVPQNSFYFNQTGI